VFLSLSLRLRSILWLDHGYHVMPALPVTPGLRLRELGQSHGLSFGFSRGSVWFVTTLSETGSTSSPNFSSYQRSRRLLTKRSQLATSKAVLEAQASIHLTLKLYYVTFTSFQGRQAQVYQMNLLVSLKLLRIHIERSFNHHYCQAR
jgi:hypothetical protein